MELNNKTDTGPLEKEMTALHSADQFAPEVSKRFTSPYRFLLTIAVSIFGIEVLTILMLAHLPSLNSKVETMLDALSLIIFVFPILYLYSFRPLVRFISKNSQMQAALKQLNETLERRIDERTMALQQAYEQLQVEHNERMQVEVAQQESEARYLALVEQSPVGIYIIQGERFAYVNPKFAEIFGYTPDEIVGTMRVGHDLVAIEDREMVQAQVQQRQRGEAKSHHNSFRGLRKDGTLIDIEIYGSVMTYQGKPVVIGTLLDITERKQAEVALREAKEQYRILVEETTDPIVVYQAKKMVYRNPAYVDMFGHAEAVEASYLEFVVPEDQRLVEEYYHRCLRGEKVQNPYEVAYRAQDGRRVIMEVKSGLIEYQGLPAILVVLRDVTERKLAEITLRESEERFRNLIEGSIQGVLIYRNHKPLFVNQRWAAIHGYTPAEIYQVDRFMLVAPQDRQRLEAYTQARLRGEEVISHYEYQAVHKDGSLIWLDNKVSVVTWHGEPAIQSTVFNITARKRAEVALRDSEKRFSKAFHSSPHPTIITSLNDGHYIDVNESFLRNTGYQREAVIGHTAFDLNRWVDPDERSQIEQILRDRGAVYDQEVKLRNKSGEIRDVRMSVELIELDMEPCMLSILYDITEHKRLERQLVQAQKLEAIGHLAAGIAHDFNNILGVCLGNTELALDEAPEDNPVREYLDETMTAVMRAKALVRQILTFSRQTEQERKPVMLHLVIKEVLSLLRASLPATIEIEHDIDKEHDVVFADPTQLYQILMNLASNAAHAMQETGGTLTVCLQAVEVDAPFASQHGGQPGPHVCLTVQDTGHGISPEVLDHIFEPFFTTKEKGRGTGLGLATVYGIVTSYGGFINVLSTPGEGTTFAVYLPRHMTAAPDINVTRQTMPRGRECILLVDDEPALARVGHKLLSGLGYDVVVCNSGVEALEAFRAEPERYDLVLTDQTMPKMTGTDLAGELRRQRPDLPIIVCTGFSHTLTKEKVQALGIDAVCMKPLKRHDLSVTLRQVLDRRAAQADGTPLSDLHDAMFDNGIDVIYHEGREAEGCTDALPRVSPLQTASGDMIDGDGWHESNTTRQSPAGRG